VNPSKSALGHFACVPADNSWYSSFARRQQDLVIALLERFAKKREFNQPSDARRKLKFSEWLSNSDIGSEYVREILYLRVCRGDFDAII